jgi:hypothetical protein
MWKKSTREKNRYVDRYVLRRAPRAPGRRASAEREPPSARERPARATTAGIFFFRAVFFSVASIVQSRSKRPEKSRRAKIPARRLRRRPLGLACAPPLAPALPANAVAADAALVDAPPFGLRCASGAVRLAPPRPRAPRRPRHPDARSRRGGGGGGGGGRQCGRLDGLAALALRALVVAAHEARACEDFVRGFFRSSASATDGTTTSVSPPSTSAGSGQMRFAAAGAEQDEAVVAAAHELEAATLVRRESLRRRGGDAPREELHLLLVEIQVRLHLMRQR